MRTSRKDESTSP